MLQLVTASRGAVTRSTVGGLSIIGASPHIASRSFASSSWFSSSSSRLVTPRRPAIAAAPAHTSPQALVLQRRWNSSTRQQTDSAAAATAKPVKVLATYTAPLGATFRRLKIFSLASLTLATAVCPVLLFAPGALTLSARLGLCATAIATSTASTSLIAWIGGPYVSEMRLVQLPNGKHALQLDTLTWRLQPLTTTLYEPSLIRPTQRPFASWELLINNTQLNLLEQQMDAGTKSAQSHGKELPPVLGETRYVTSGELRGSFAIERSAEDGSIRVVTTGKPLRHFQVHEELLGEDWQVLE